MQRSLAGSMFLAWVVAFAIYHFSETTADPDVWGHTLFGQRMLALGTIERAEPFSWTARGHDWTNHEVLAEVVMGLAHRLAGGPGLLLLKFILGMATFALALRLGLHGLKPEHRWAAWLVAALAVVEIAFGFAVRPQMFTALALAVLLWVLRRIHEGRAASAIALPFLFGLWVNTHGGALAGFALLILTAASTSLVWAWGRCRHSPSSPASGTVPATLWVSVGASALALAANPWGWKLVPWLVRDVSWSRTQIQEWQSAAIGWDHAPMIALAVLGVAALAVSRRPKPLWETLGLAALGVQALLHVRHTPLFAVAALAILPPHFADAAERCRRLAPGLAAATGRTAMRRIAALAFALMALATLWAAVRLNRERCYTLEVPRKQYPVAAVDFIRSHDLRGDLLVFFDWGEMCLWELPDCAPSIDGRLNTCYPFDAIRAHWRFYNGEPDDRAALDLDRADLAILPPRLAGSRRLAQDPRWCLVYDDPVASVLVRNPERFPALVGMTVPVLGGKSATEGRVSFPSTPSRRACPRMP